MQKRFTGSEMQARPGPRFRGACCSRRIRRRCFRPCAARTTWWAAGNSLEVAAGTQILEQGGNAVDAGVATVLAASITEMDHFGLGGEMPLLIKMKGQPVVVVSGVGTAPALATREFFNSRKPEPWEDKADMPPIPVNGILAATVPGVFDGLMLALEKYGTMSFAQVAAPALGYTRGFPATEILSSYIQS